MQTKPAIRRNQVLKSQIKAPNSLISLLYLESLKEWSLGAKREREWVSQSLVTIFSDLELKEWES